MTAGFRDGLWTRDAELYALCTVLHAAGVELGDFDVVPPPLAVHARLRMRDGSRLRFIAAGVVEVLHTAAAALSCDFDFAIPFASAPARRWDA